MTVKGVSTWERGEWETAWGKMGKEAAGKDRRVGTVIRQEADLEDRKRPVHVPRKRGREEGPPSQEKQGKPSAPEVPFIGLFVSSGW